MTDSENNSHTLSLDSECDLGILFKKNLKLDEHIDKVVNKVNRISCLIDPFHIVISLSNRSSIEISIKQFLKMKGQIAY